jgi:hypothetical protein
VGALIFVARAASGAAFRAPAGSLSRYGLSGSGEDDAGGRTLVKGIRPSRARVRRPVQAEGDLVVSLADT